MYRMAVRLVVQLNLKILDVPIIAITGTNGKTTTTRLIERIIGDAGYNMGVGTTDGASHNGRLVWDGDAAGVYGAWVASRCPDIDILVLETARGGIIKHGTGFYHCQVGVVTNVYEDHLGLDGITTIAQMAEVKASVAERVEKNGTLVLNADNAYVRRMAKKSRAGAIFFTTGGDDAQYERLFFLRGDCIYKRINRTETFVIDASTIPITYHNAVSYNTENVLAALACVEGIQRSLPIEWNSIKRTLISFGSDAKDNFNRFCMFAFSSDQVILTRCKNPESCRQDMKIVEQVRKNASFDHVVGIMSGIGNRQENFYKEMSAIAASICDYFFIRPPKPKYLRGKTGEEIVRLVASEIPKERILSYRQSTLPEIMDLSRKKLDGRILFVVLNINIEEKINFFEVSKAADSVNQLIF